MQTNVQICAFIRDTALSDQVTGICAAQGWTVWLLGESPHENWPGTPDIVIFDDLDWHANVADMLRANPQTQGLFLGPASSNDKASSPFTFLDQDKVSAELVPTLTTLLNITRFETQFFTAQAAEPITKLPHHPELLEFVARFQGQPTGLIVVQIDHADHLYANLDPVSKTDLLGALSDHLHKALPHTAYMGIYDAASFAVWCPGAEAEDVQRLAVKLCASSQTPLDFRGGQLHFSISAGYAFNVSLANPQDLWQQAWTAKEQARVDGGDGLIGATSQAELGARIPEALSRNEFGLVLQPQWDIQGAAIRGVESLLRWQGMEVGRIDPDHFIPIAEQNGQMARVGDWVLEHACCESATWLEHLVAPILLGVNVSPQQFANDAIKLQLERLAKDQWLDPGILELELSHDKLLHVVDQHRGTLFALRDLGVRIAIDNLGVGVVDTNKLLRCPADTLKLDRKLVANIEDDAGARTLVEQICRVGQRFSLRTVAVGVERESQRQMLEDLGCTDAQGYLFSAPIALEKFQQYLATAKRAHGRKEVAR